MMEHENSEMGNLQDILEDYECKFSPEMKEWIRSDVQCTSTRDRFKDELPSYDLLLFDKDFCLADLLKDASNDLYDSVYQAWYSQLELDEMLFVEDDYCYSIEDISEALTSFAKDILEQIKTVYDIFEPAGFAENISREQLYATLEKTSEKWVENGGDSEFGKTITWDLWNGMKEGRI